MGHGFGSIDELGEGHGFRKVRAPLGITAFGANVIVYPPGFKGFHHFHDTQDELYFVHSGSARVEVEGDDRILEPRRARPCRVDDSASRLERKRDRRPRPSRHRRQGRLRGA